MIFSKKNVVFFNLFSTLIFGFFLSCKTNSDLQIRKVNARIVNINENQETNKDIDALIKPYSEDVNQKMNTILCNNPTVIEKKSINKYQNEIGNWMSDVVFEYSKRVFEKDNNLKLDICMLNSGGVRTILPAGNVTTRNAFEIMPFENEIVVLEMNGEAILEMAYFIIKEQKPHPMCGMKIFLDKEAKIIAVKVGNFVVDQSKKYYVATNDYLANGNDNMTFFLKSTNKYKTNYKIRNLLIDYFKDVKEITFSKDDRIISQ
ncbi:MAG: 5'-nucleotidase C-terminal domain-containing protein [Flavobacterium sp.]|jgi:2',3'-cyclic-nucleotide 2'-phosphodiesterase (5'-nucleotidase family)